MTEKRNDTGSPLELDSSTQDNLYAAAKAIKYNIEQKNISPILFSSINDYEGTAEAAIHISHLLTQLKQKVLIINMNTESADDISAYFDIRHVSRLMETLGKSPYLSEAIRQTQYDNLDFIGVESDIPEDELTAALNENNIKTKLNPLKNYYDCIIMVGPDYEGFSKYSNILELVDSAVTVSKNRTSNYRKLRKYLDDLELFNVLSLGVIRHR